MAVETDRLKVYIVDEDGQEIELDPIEIEKQRTKLKAALAREDFLSVQKEAFQAQLDDINDGVDALNNLFAEKRIVPLFQEGGNGKKSFLYCVDRNWLRKNVEEGNKFDGQAVQMPNGTNVNIAAVQQGVGSKRGGRNIADELRKELREKGGKVAERGDFRREAAEAATQQFMQQELQAQAAQRYTRDKDLGRFVFDFYMKNDEDVERIVPYMGVGAVEKLWREAQRIGLVSTALMRDAGDGAKLLEILNKARALKFDRHTWKESHIQNGDAICAPIDELMVLLRLGKRGSFPSTPEGVEKMRKEFMEELAEGLQDSQSKNNLRDALWVIRKVKGIPCLGPYTFHGKTPKQVQKIGQKAKDAEDILQNRFAFTISEKRAKMIYRHLLAEPFTGDAHARFKRFIAEITDEYHPPKLKEEYRAGKDFERKFIAWLMSVEKPRKTTRRTASWMHILSPRYEQEDWGRRGTRLSAAAWEGVRERAGGSDSESDSASLFGYHPTDSD